MSVVEKSPKLSWSPQQAAFLDWAKNGTGSCVLIAVAGAGKTTVLLAAGERMGGNVAYVAFNRDIVADTNAKLKERGVDWKTMRAGTAHSFGFGALKKIIGNDVRVEGYKVSNIVETMIEEDLKRYKKLEPFKANICQLVSHAKQGIFGVGNSDDRDVSKWFEIADRHDIFDNEDRPPVDEIIAMAQAALAKSNEVTDIIDFDDMIYMALLLKAPFWTFNVVMIDEAQDTNRARRALVRAMLKKGGRVVAVGDPCQAIYGFCHPAGTKVLTPSGHRMIEDLMPGDAVITSNSSGELGGWKGNRPIIQTHKYSHSGVLITLTAADRKVSMTPHHKVPVRIDPSAKYYTYMMRRNGVYRAGHCQAYTTGSGTGDFMLAMRCRTEGADTAWLLGTHATKEDAMAAEGRLLLRMKGDTFSKMSEAQVAKLPTDEVEALKILSEHGRMVDFPLITPKRKSRFSRDGAFITEACNILDGMRVAFYDKSQAEGGRHGQRQKFVWSPVEVSTKHFSGYVYGITVPATPGRNGEDWPLYFGGDDILVHNTGADADSLELIKQDFNAIELPLTVSYRCPQAVVKFANQWVDHIQAAPTAPEGSVSTTTLDEFVKRNDLTKDAAVLSRTNAPIVELAFNLIRRRIPCRIEGRDIGKSIIKLMTRWKITSLEDLEDRLDQHLAKETTKLLAAKKEVQLARLEDAIATVKVIVDQCRKEGKHEISDAVERVNSLFGENVKDMLVLSSIHKSKGREWKRVFWLDRLGTCPSKWARQAWQQVQEKNLMYVCATRAKEDLIEIVTA